MRERCQILGEDFCIDTYHREFNIFFIFITLTWNFFFVEWLYNNNNNKIYSLRNRRRRKTN
jgi:hypothetical protein